MIEREGRAGTMRGTARLAAMLLSGLWLAVAVVPAGRALAQEAGGQTETDDDGATDDADDPAEGARQPGDGAATKAADGASGPAPARVRDPNRGQVTNLPLPRYVSLKGSEGNARRGPSLSHRIDWVFRHAGMPLRVTAEYGHWRRVEDAEGAGGWVHYSLLSGVRTAIIQQEMADLRARPNPDAAVTARAEQGAIVKLGACRTEWCQITGGGTSGWVPQAALWGVDKGEVRD